MRPIHLHLLGPLEIQLDDRPPPTLRRKTRALLGFLALQDGPVSRHKLAAWFCQTANDPTRALNLLLSRLRPLHADLIVRSGDTVQLNSSLVTTDLEPFLAPPEQRDATNGRGQLAQAIALYRGELMAGLSLPNASEFELWLLGERTRLRRLYEQGLLALMAQHTEAGELDAGIAVGQRLLQSDGLNEAAHRQLMWLYAQNGQREAALQQYAQCRALLAAELAVAPSDEVEALHEQIRGQRAVTQPIFVRPEATRTAAVTGDAFVGREAAVGQLTDAWRQLAPNPLLLSGPAGSGKSRLLRWFSAEIPHRQQHLTHCYESTRDLPYHPWRTLIENELETWQAAQFAELPRFVRTGLLQLLPQFASQFGERDRPLLGDATQLFAAVRQFFQHLAKNKPQLLAIDDMQWADAGSLNLFHYLARTSARDRLLLVMAYRSESAETTPRLQRLLRDLQPPSNAHISLTPLRAADVIQLLASEWPRLPESDRTATSERLVAASGGSPFYLTELLRSLTDGDRLPDELPLPSTINMRVEQQLEALSGDAKQVVETLAVLGEPVQFSTVEACSGRGEQACSGGLDQAVKNGMVTVDAAGRYQLAHDILRGAIGQQTAAGRQLLLHRRAARLLAQRTALLPAQTQPQAAADLLRHALAGEAHDLVFRWAYAAARSTLHVYAYEDTERIAEQGIAAFAYQPAPDEVDAVTAHRMVDLLLIWARAHFYREFDGALMAARLDQIAQLLARHPDALRGAELTLARAAWEGRAGQIGLMATGALEAYEQFVALEAWPLALEALQSAATSRISTSQNHAGLALYEQALALALETDSAEAVISCRSGLAWTHINLGQVEQALAQLNAALEHDFLEHDAVLRGNIYFGLAAAWCMYEHAGNTRHFAQEAHACFSEVGANFMRTRCALYLSNAHVNEGDLAASDALLTAALAEAEQMSDGWMIGWSAQILGRNALARGAFAEAEAQLTRAFELRQTAGMLQNQVSDLVWLGRLALARGEADEAVKLTTRAIAQWERFSAEFFVYEMPDVWMAFAETLTAVGRHDEARTAIDHAHETLTDYAAQIVDAGLREQFLARPSSRYVTGSFAQGRLIAA